MAEILLEALTEVQQSVLVRDFPEVAEFAPFFHKSCGEEHSSRLPGTDACAEQLPPVLLDLF